MAGVSAARKVAFDILMAVARDEERSHSHSHSHSDDLLRGAAVDALAGADRNLATALVLGVLRWQLLLDQQINPLLKRPGRKLDAEVRVALRMGAFQLLHLDRIPAHAAIDESVGLVKRAGRRYSSGMVNAVLRRLAASGRNASESGTAGRGGAIANEGPVSGHDRGTHAVRGSRAAIATSPVGALAPAEIAATQAHPAWMVERWMEFFGAEAACAICMHGQQQPRISVRIADAQAEADLVEAGIELGPGAMLTAARTVIAGDVPATAAFRAGHVRIQDEGSQLVGEIAACAATALLQDQRKILDACAAPGGKTLILAERIPLAKIVACEASAPRLAALRERVAGLGDRVECRLADASTLDVDGEFDLVLTDVPCSGTGTLGRNPEIRHRLRVEDLARQAKRQRAILQAALRAVRPGGRVVYSTCSLEPEENERVVAEVLAESANARQASVLDFLQAMRRDGILTEPGWRELEKCITSEGALRLMPGTLGTDGFFAAVMEQV